MIKKFLLICMSLFLVVQSYKLIGLIHRIDASSWWLSFVLAWVINMFITGIFAFATFASPIQKLLPDAYYRVTQPESLKNWYKRLNVSGFRKILLATLWRSKAQRKKYFNGKADGLKGFEVESAKAEFGHLIPFVLLNFVGIYILIIGSIKLGIFVLIFNFMGNFYPIVLQRHHRMRIQAIRQRQGIS